MEIRFNYVFPTNPSLQEEDPSEMKILYRGQETSGLLTKGSLYIINGHRGDEFPDKDKPISSARATTPSTNPASNLASSSTYSKIEVYQVCY